MVANYFGVLSYATYTFRTRAIFFEFSLYNANVNLFQTVQFVVEFLESGGLFPDIEIKTVGLIRYITPNDYFKLAMEVIKKHMHGDLDFYTMYLHRSFLLFTLWK